MIRYDTTWYETMQNKAGYICSIRQQDVQYTCRYMQQSILSCPKTETKAAPQQAPGKKEESRFSKKTQT